MPDYPAALTSLRNALPESWRAFEGTQYPMPACQAILGDFPDMPRLGKWLEDARADELKRACEPAVVAAEVIESQQPDRGTYFLDDEQVRAVVFRGAKWRAGWVLLAGDGVSESLVSRLKAAEYMLFSARHPSLMDRVLPARETAPVYFLQLMVRYAMTWGMIRAGDDHEMAHFLEKDMPGAMAVCGRVSDLEGLVLLGLMKMGCPAVVGADFPYDIGPRAAARNDDEVLQALGGFPNMRVRYLHGVRLAWPEGADPAHAKEEFPARRRATGLFQLRPGDGKSGVVVTGDAASDEMAVIVEVSDARLDLPVSAHLEAQALRFGSYLKGVRTSRGDDGAFTVETAAPDGLDGRRLGDVILAGLRHKYPRLGAAQVRVEFGAAAVQRERATAQEFAHRRDEAILAESEATVDEFHLCIDCQPFSQAHVCVVTPDRPPMCSRPRNEIKAGALWGTDYRPWTRRQVGAADLQYAVAKGAPIDEAGGEWAGINEAASRLTGGKVERVRFHSVAVCPHTACGCFGAVAYVIPEIGGIGIVHRGYLGPVPGGLSWTLLANRVGGKQFPGVTAFNLQYLNSPKAFGGEGGLAAVKWATKKALEVMRPHLPAGARIATEDDATTLEQLKQYLAG